MVLTFRFSIKLFLHHKCKISGLCRHNWQFLFEWYWKYNLRSTFNVMLIAHMARGTLYSWRQKSYTARSFYGKDIRVFPWIFGNRIVCISFDVNCLYHFMLTNRVKNRPICFLISYLFLICIYFIYLFLQWTINDKHIFARRSGQEIVSQWS